jgi:hypothetical protein
LINSASQERRPFNDSVRAGFSETWIAFFPSRSRP